MSKLICAGGLIIKSDKFLFGKRSPRKDWAPGVWDIVGGKSLRNEHPLLTLQRETFEETGIRILNAELIKTLEINYPGKHGSFTYHIFIITAFKGRPVNCTDEHTKLKWFTREELASRSLALPEYLTIIDEWRGRIPTQAT